MPEKVRAFERRSLVVHKGIRKDQAALVLLPDEDPDEPDEDDPDDDDPEEDEPDEDPLEESDFGEEDEDESDDEEVEEDDSLLAGTVLLFDARLSVR
jgi:hypothetical protein